MNKENKWKDYLLKSGIPLEYEIFNYLDSKQCQSYFEFSYLRENEEKKTTEFSYDIDSSYIKPPHWIDLMIECKYRHESTKWLFLPAEYGGSDEIGYSSFMHPNDYFNSKNKSFFQCQFPLPFAPLCSKGIEITSDGQNPKTITQAIMQLSYAISEKIAYGFYHQTDEILLKHYNGVVFYNIPVIITTAELYRIKENIKINDIRATDNIADIATREDCLVIKSKPSVELERYNYSIFQKFITEHGRDKLSELLNTFSSDLDFVMSVISEHYAPSCIVVIEHKENNEAFEKLFKYLDLVINPTEEILDIIKKRNEEINKIAEKLKRK